MRYLPEIMAVLTFGMVLFVGLLVNKLWDQIDRVKAIREQEEPDIPLPEHYADE